jgi:hypothetical protein
MKLKLEKEIKELSEQGLDARFNEGDLVSHKKRQGVILTIYYDCTGIIKNKRFSNLVARILFNGEEKTEIVLASELTMIRRKKKEEKGYDGS